jgi:hypothetical protein
MFADILFHLGAMAMLSPAPTLTLTRKPQSCPENVVGCCVLLGTN